MDYSTWMAKLEPGQSIASVSIPGTHESCALYDHNTAWFTQCQKKTIPEQLQMGIRFLDLRADQNFQINHGGYDQYINLGQVQEQVIAFLDENPTEFVLINIQMSSQSNTIHFTQKFHELLTIPVASKDSPIIAGDPAKFREGTHASARTTTDDSRLPDHQGGPDGPTQESKASSEYWFLDDRIPTVNEARKKMILIRAYEPGQISPPPKGGERATNPSRQWPTIDLLGEERKRHPESGQEFDHRGRRGSCAPLPLLRRWCQDGHRH